jgi:putative ABC transport system permease protein
VRVNGAETLERLMMLPVLLYRAFGFGFLALGGIALLLSAASLHAVTACAVTSRTREIGIRRALGAPSGGLVMMAVRRASLQLAAGTALGALLGIALLRLAAIFPWRLGTGSPLMLAAVPVVLGAAVLFALAGPLTRALSIRPADALRYD